MFLCEVINAGKHVPESPLREPLEGGLSTVCIFRSKPCILSGMEGVTRL
jgi:hypothetical protein